MKKLVFVVLALVACSTLRFQESLSPEKQKSAYWLKSSEDTCAYLTEGYERGFTGVKCVSQKNPRHLSFTFRDLDSATSGNAEAFRLFQSWCASILVLEGADGSFDIYVGEKETNQGLCSEHLSK